MSDSNTHPVTTGFSGFNLGSALQRGIASAGFTEPRPIQRDTIPAALEGRDVLGLAQTGTGKTAAFSLPILERLLSKPQPGPRALILAPTRELAKQIEDEIRVLSRFARITTTTIYGGVAMQRQIQAVRRRPDIIVACPGRLLDLMNQRVVRLDGIETLVLDEADHMFDMGFLPDVRRILAALPRKRQNLLFSATMPGEIRHLADNILVNPHVVELAHSMPADTIEHALYPVAEGKKLDLLKHLISEGDFASAIIFTRTKHRARRVAEQLGRTGHRAVALQGNMSQSQRDRAMNGFRSGSFDILVATDIAARGIDVAKVSHVVNFDVPNTPDAYTHRIGRTGRSERQGKACTFVTGEDRGSVRAIERKIGNRIPVVNVAGFADASFQAPPHRGSAPARPPRGPAPSHQGRGGRHSSGEPRSGGNRNRQENSRQGERRNDHRDERRADSGFRNGSEPRREERQDRPRFRSGEEPRREGTGRPGRNRRRRSRRSSQNGRVS